MAKQQMNDDLGATSATQRMGSAPLPAQRSVSRPWTPPAGMGGACIHPKRPPAPLCATLPIQSPLPFPWRLPVGATFTVDPLTLVLLLVFTFTTGKYCLLLSPPASLPGPPDSLLCVFSSALTSLNLTVPLRIRPPEGVVPTPQPSNMAMAHPQPVDPISFLCADVLAPALILNKRVTTWCSNDLPRLLGRPHQATPSASLGPTLVPAGSGRSFPPKCLYLQPDGPSETQDCVFHCPLAASQMLQTQHTETGLPAQLRALEPASALPTHSQPSLKPWEWLRGRQGDFGTLGALTHRFVTSLERPHSRLQPLCQGQSV